MDKIQEVSIKEKEYPGILKKIPNPPQVLYFRGKMTAKENCFAIVGTRRPSSYGKQTTFDIANGLVGNGLTIISGMAPGIDTFAHQAVLENKGRTIAVLGTGLDEESIYPQSNLKLSREILEHGGCLISEYPVGTKGAKFTFPQRNRIVSGMSLGVLVVEAKIKSGSLITAGEAFRQKRKVFAVPGSIYSSNSKGSHFLIKKGAVLAENAEDILKGLGLSAKIGKVELNGENEEEILILGLLKEGSLHADRIIEETKLPAQKIMGTLAVLEIKGKIRNLGANIFARNTN